MEIEIVTLDNWHRSLEDPPATIDLIKVDTEGFERFVIEGGQQVFRMASFVIMEASFRAIYQGSAVYESPVSLMKNLGFTVKVVSAGYDNRANGELVAVDVLFERMVR